VCPHIDHINLVHSYTGEYYAWVFILQAGVDFGSSLFKHPDGCV